MQVSAVRGHGRCAGGLTCEAYVAMAGRAPLRLKGHRSLGKHTRRGLQRVTLLCLSSLIVVQTAPVVRLREGDVDGLRTCTRRVA